MTERWIVAALHFLALGVGLGAILDRAWSLRGPLDQAGLRRVFRADMLWGLAALLWIGTGLWRAFGGLEKGSEYYLGSLLFWHKMALFVLVLLLEIPPMITLIRWRVAIGQGRAPDTARAPLLARFSFLEAFVVVLIVFVAAAMARGAW